MSREPSLRSAARPRPAHTPSKGLNRKCSSEPGRPGAGVSLGWSAAPRSSVVRVMPGRRPQEALNSIVVQVFRGLSKALRNCKGQLPPGHRLCPALSVFARGPLLLLCSQPSTLRPPCACSGPHSWGPALSLPRLPDPLPFLALPPARTPLCPSSGLRP